MGCGEEHAVALDAHECCWGEVGYDDDVFIYEFFWRVGACDA